MFRTKLAVAVLVSVSLSNGGDISCAAEDQTGWTRLFNGKDLSGWRQFPVPPSSAAGSSDTWRVQSGEIVCSGKPTGYLITNQEFENYVLRLQWRWGDNIKQMRGPNSGVMVHVVGEDKIYPKGIEAQLASTRAGDFWSADGFRLKVDEARRDARQPAHYWRIKVNEQDEIERPLGQWNDCVITCAGDTVRVAVNGFDVNVGTEAECSEGRILLQSEGTEIHFRNVELKSLQ